MRFFLVTRSRFDYAERHIRLLKTMLAEAAEDAKGLRHELVGLVAGQNRIDDLVKIIVGMKKGGFEPTPEIIELVPEKDLPSSIWEAIQEVSTKGTREYYTNMAYAHEAIEAKSSTEEIVSRILYGQDVEV